MMTRETAGRWTPLAALAAAGCFLASGAHAQQGAAGADQQEIQLQQQSQQQQQGEASGYAQQRLEMEGLEQEKIEKLSEKGFPEKDVQKALAKSYEQQGIEAEQAQAQAEQVARSIAATMGMASESSQAAAGQRGRDEGRSGSANRQQGGVEEMAPEGAEIKDSAEMVVNEERLNVEKREVPVGGVVLRKTVTSDEASETVELRSEDVEIARVSPDEAQQQGQQADTTPINEAFREGEVFIPLEREEAIAEKEVETREIVRAEPEVETEEQQFEATLRRENVEVERVGERPGNGQRQGAQAQAQVAQGQSQRNAGSQSETAAQLEDDSDYSAREQFDDLEQRVRSELRSSDLEAQDLERIEIEAEDNSVRLSGRVSSQEVKQQIEEIVRGLPEVDEVESELEL